MQILISVKEEVTTSLVIDTDNFQMSNNEEERVFEIAEIINDAKNNPESYFIQDGPLVTEEREKISVEVKRYTE